MRDYELVYILDPDLSEEALGGLMERFRTLATTQGAEVKSQERWEKRRLAYEIKDKREGTYVVMEFSAPSAAVQELDRILKITDGVLRHLIVIAEEGAAAPAKPAETAAAPAETPAPAEEPATESAPAAEPEPQNPVEGSVEEEDEAPAEDTEAAGEESEAAPAEA